MKAAGGREYSKRLGTLFPDQLQTALDHFGLGTLLRAEPVTLGLFGQNVFLMTDNGEYVLRGAPHYAWQFPKERFFARLLHENTSVPVPWPYFIDYSDGIFGWSYAIMPRLAGLQLIDPQFQERQSPEDRFGIACAMGETLACMHTLTWSHCGEYNADSDDIQPLDVTFAEWIVARVREYLELAIPHSDRTTEVDVRWVEDLIAQATDALQVPFEPCFVMQDFKEGNAVAKRIQGTWRISGVFDLMEPYFGDGEADLSRSVAVYAAKDPALARAFVQAYLKQSLAYGNPRRYGFAERFPIYMLLDRLIIWQYGQRHGVWWDPGLTLREWASPFTSLTVVCSKEGRAMRKPNVLIFMTDHQRADTVLPEHPAVTPNLDRFAQEGVTFTNAYCPSPHCCPSRATFFSGLYPSRHGVWNNVCNRQALSRGLNEGIRLWSEDLADTGYQMHFSGKWHVSVAESPADRGWREHFVSASAGTHHGVTWEHYRRIAEQPDPLRRGEAQILRPGYGTYRLYGTGADEGTAHDEAAVEKALDVLDTLQADAEPWCLYVGAIAPHDPYDVPQRFLELYDLDDVPLPVSYADELIDKPTIYRRMRDTLFGQLSQREVREGIRHFWAYCSYLDALFGRLLGALDRAGCGENTLVLYCSDHGDYCGEHGLFAKGIPCFRGAYNVPAIIRWPAAVQNVNRRVEAFVSLADFAPTLLEAAGLALDRHFTGASLMPFLLDEPPPEWRDAIHTQCNGVELYYTQRSATTKELKYVFNGFDKDELYDLRMDPHEMRNLADDPAYADAKRELCRRVWRFAHREDDTAINPYITVGLAPYGPAEAFR